MPPEGRTSNYVDLGQDWGTLLEWHCHVNTTEDSEFRASWSIDLKCWDPSCLILQVVLTARPFIMEGMVPKENIKK